jgi:hypothetical protein
MIDHRLAALHRFVMLRRMPRAAVPPTAMPGEGEA